MNATAVSQCIFRRIEYILKKRTVLTTEDELLARFVAVASEFGYKISSIDINLSKLKVDYKIEEI